MCAFMTIQEAKNQMVNTDKAWFKKEEEELIIEYTMNEFDLLTICIIHKRMPMSIINKLKKLNIISARNEVRGWDLLTRSELYNTLSKNKPKNKKQKDKKADNVKIDTATTASIYSYPIKDTYQKIIDEMNEKEEKLKYEIKYYRENSEQALRIKEYERELEMIKGNIHNSFMRKQGEYLTNVKHNTYIGLCIKNFDIAFTRYKNNRLSKNYEDGSRPYKNIMVITEKLDTGYHELIYTFTNELDKDGWIIDCDVSTFVYNHDGKLIKELYTCRINGTFTTADGYRPFSTHDIIV
jgi:hypothetical protein